MDTELGIGLLLLVAVIVSILILFTTSVLIPNLADVVLDNIVTVLDISVKFVDLFNWITRPCGPGIPPVIKTVPVAPVPPMTELGSICIADTGGVVSCIDPVAPVPYWDAVIISVS